MATAATATRLRRGHLLSSLKRGTGTATVTIRREAGNNSGGGRRGSILRGSGQRRSAPKPAARPPPPPGGGPSPCASSSRQPCRGTARTGASRTGPPPFLHLCCLGTPAFSSESREPTPPPPVADMRSSTGSFARSSTTASCWSLVNFKLGRPEAAEPIDLNDRRTLGDYGPSPAS
jgi:hypothetical protein